MRGPAVGFVCAVAALGAVGARSPVSPAPFWEPDATSAGAPAFVDGAWQVEEPAFRARLKLLEAAERLEFIRRRTGVEVDPFAVRPQAGAAFVSFLLEIENRSGGPLSFEPGTCLLVGADRELRTPLDWGSIEAAYAAMDRTMPPAYRKIRPALLEGASVLGPGRRLEGLLVYRVPGSLRTFRVEVVLTTAVGERVGFAAPHRLVRRPRRKP